MWNWFSRPAPKHRTHRARRCGFRPHLEALEDRCCPSSGTLDWSDPTGGLFDPTFGSGGTALSTTGSSNQALTSVTVLPDGKLLTAGYTTVTSGGYPEFAAARYNADGTFDTSFGSGGVATFDLSKFGQSNLAMAAAIQPGTGGKILLAGLAGSQFGVIRLNPNGTLDTTFGAKGSQGIVTARPDNNIASYAYSMAVLPDGKILLAGMAKNGPTDYYGSLALARFNANGTLDTTFGNRGTVLTTIMVIEADHLIDHPVNVAVDGNGRIVVAASNGVPDFLVAGSTRMGASTPPLAPRTRG